MSKPPGTSELPSVRLISSSSHHEDDDQDQDERPVTQAGPSSDAVEAVMPEGIIQTANSDAQRSTSVPHIEPVKQPSSALPEPASVLPEPTTIPTQGERPRVASNADREQPTANTMGSVANRRSASSFHIFGNGDGAESMYDSYARPRSPRRARKTSSFVRLSMNSEGAAEIITKDTLSPSPPRPQPTMYTFDGKGSVGASQSEAASGPLPAPRLGTSLQRASSGRSRDSRSWEFWCDKECRSELESKAEKDSSGSAANAISLLRSASGRSILGAVPNKRNSVLAGHDGPNKRMRRDQRGPLQRSSTHNGRLQGKGQGTTSGKPVPRLKDTKSALSTYIPGNDSDKENWSPGSVTHFDDQYPDEVSRSARRRVPQSSKLRNAPAQLRTEAADPEDDPELAAFMRAGNSSDESSGKEDLDCVQGLLSLSQGNWR